MALEFGASSMVCVAMPVNQSYGNLEAAFGGAIKVDVFNHTTSPSNVSGVRGTCMGTEIARVYVSGIYGKSIVWSIVGLCLSPPRKAYFPMMDSKL